MLARNRPTILDTTVTGAAASFYSVPIMMDGQSDCSLQCQAVGTAVGTSLKVYGSNIYSEADGKTIAASIAANEWVEVPLINVTLPTGGNWVDMVRLPKGTCPFEWIILAYVNASGTSTFKVFFKGR